MLGRLEHTDIETLMLQPHEGIKLALRVTRIESTDVEVTTFVVAAGAFGAVVTKHAGRDAAHQDAQRGEGAAHYEEVGFDNSKGVLAAKGVGWGVGRGLHPDAAF